MDVNIFNKEMAFEIEDMENRKNYTFHYIPTKNEVIMLNTSIGSSNNILKIFPDNTSNEYETKFPFGCKNAHEYFKHMYKKSLNDSRFMFLGEVDIKNYNPIED